MNEPSQGRDSVDRIATYRSNPPNHYYPILSACHPRQPNRISPIQISTQKAFESRDSVTMRCIALHALLGTGKLWRTDHILNCAGRVERWPKRPFPSSKGKRRARRRHVSSESQVEEALRLGGARQRGEVLGCDLAQHTA